MSEVKYRMKDLPKDEGLRKFFGRGLKKLIFYGEMKKWQNFIKEERNMIK